MFGLVLCTFCALVGQHATAGASQPKINLPALFSGTNCNFTAGTGDLGVVVPQLMSSKLTFEGDGDSFTKTHDFSGMDPANRPTTDSFVVRFASTHFPDGSTVTVKYECTDVLGTKYGPIQGTATIYNKGLTLATKEEYYDPPLDNNVTPPVDPPLGYYVVNPLLPDGYAKASQDSMPAARATLQSPKHTILNSSDLLTETQLATYLKQATCFLGFTHGEVDNFRASEADALYFAGNPNEVAGYVQSGRTAPPFNLVVLHACSTLGGSGNAAWQAPVAFQVANFPPSTDIPDRAYASFTTIVWSLNKSKISLKDHAVALYTRLAGGGTIAEAVALANQKVFPMSATGKSLGMIVRGDKRAKLYNVYLSQSESSATLEKEWYWVLN